MNKRRISILCQLSAGVLLLRASLPAIVAGKQSFDDARTRELQLSRTLVAALRPPKPMQGVPLMSTELSHGGVKTGTAAWKSATSATPKLTMLDEVGRIPSGMSPAHRRSWVDQIHTGVSGAAGRARLHVLIGEYDMAVRHEPAAAAERFAMASRIAPAASREYGLARYDLALATFYEGSYREATVRLNTLLDGDLRGFDRRNAAMFARHASSCAAFHDERAAMGISEPVKLDPLCGVSAMSVCLRALGLAYGEDAVSRLVRHDGEGSTLQDISDAAEKMGLASHAFSATDEALRSLPMPLVAHVERDHFIAVQRVDDKGVVYVCSDCGRWPGGQRRATWKQWRVLVPDAYLSVSRKDDESDLALSDLTGDRPNRMLYAAVAGSVPIAEAGAGRIAARVRRGAVRTFLNLLFAGCVVKPSSNHCSCVVCCPMTGDPVNLATGEEEYEPGADLAVYNPKGPSVSWQRNYNSLSNGRTYSNYSSEDGFGLGWSHTYDVGVEEYTGTVAQPQAAQSNSVVAPPGGGNNQVSGYVVFPNTSRISFTGTLPSSTTPKTTMTVSNGYPILIECLYDATSTKHYFTVTLSDRGRWECEQDPENSSSPFHRLHRIYDRVGNFISFHYGAHPVDGGRGGGGSVTRLDEIDDSAGQWLVTLGISSVTGQYSSVNDRYGRSVYYTSAPNFPWTILGDVSQVVATGSSTQPVRYRHTYLQIDNGEGLGIPYLQTLAQPSPTGTGLSTRTFNYTSRGYIDNIVDGNGNKTVFTQTPGNTTKVSLTDPQGNVVRAWTESFDNTMSDTGSLDANGQSTVTYAYGDPNDPFVPSSETINMAGGSKTWTCTYDRYGNLLTETTPKGMVTTKTYDYSQFPIGELTSVKQGTKTPTSFTYFEPSGLLHEKIVPIPGQAGSGVENTVFAYDALGNPTQVTIPGNNATSSRSTYYGYTIDGGYSQTEALGRPITITDALGKVVHLRYNARGDAVSYKDQLGNETQTVYNLAGQPTGVLAPATGNTGAGNASEIHTYLYVGGPLVQTAALDESGTTVRTTNVTYGAEGESLTRTGSTQAIAVSYDAAYHVKSVTDGNGHATGYTYDLNGRTTQIAYPGASGANGDRIQFTSYDVAGRVLSRTDGNGQITNFGYGDADGKLTTVTYPGATAKNVALAYDSYDRLSSVADAASTGTCSYDDNDAVMTSTRTYTGIPAQTVTYTCWPDGSRRTMTNSAGVWTYNYDADGRYTSLTSPAGTSSVSYYDNGQPASRALPNGATTDCTYNAVRLPTQVKSQVGPSALSQYGSIAYDGSFNLKRMTATVPVVPTQGGTTNFSYDAKDRLTQESSTRLSGYTGNFAYDAADNPVTFKGATQTFDADNRQTGSTLFAYDGDGNPTTYKGTSFGFDPECRVSSIGPNFSAEYRADGHRAWKSVAGTKTYYLYDGGEPVVELDATGAVKSINVFAPDGLVGRKQAGSWTYYTFDPHGNVAQRLNASGAVLSSSVYDAYGVESNAGTSPSDTFGYRARYGYLLDRETGLYLCGHRYYNPATGRWISRDPVGAKGGPNVYGYCAGNAVGNVDPSGTTFINGRWVEDPPDAGYLNPGGGDLFPVGPGEPVWSAGPPGSWICLDPGEIGKCCLPNNWRCYEPATSTNLDQGVMFPLGEAGPWEPYKEPEDQPGLFPKYWEPGVPGGEQGYTPYPIVPSTNTNTTPDPSHPIPPQLPGTEEQPPLPGTGYPASEPGGGEPPAMGGGGTPPPEEEVGGGAPWGGGEGGGPGGGGAMHSESGIE